MSMLRPLLSEQAKITTQPRLRILCCLLLDQAAAQQNGQEEKGWILLYTAAGHLPSSTTQEGTLVKWPQLGEMCRWHRGHLLMAASPSHATLPLKCCPTYLCQPYGRTAVRTTLLLF